MTKTRQVSFRGKKEPPGRRRNMPVKKAAWGGKREGAGRPVSETKRKRRALCFLDSEWQTIRRKAEEKNLSPREYLFLLVEKYN